MKLDNIPRVSLTHLPTPLDEAPRLADQIGLRKLLIKRDDCTTLALGGNKARKLEYLMADALAHQADVVMTDGGPQSNHARLTAAAARKVGIDRCILYLGGPRFDRFHGNLLLEVVLGAEIRFMEDATVAQMEDAMNAEAESLRGQGLRPYVIPIGGSTGLGALGYVRAMQELADQLGPDDRAPMVFVAVGSGGTIAGCRLGTLLFLPRAEVIGISVSRKARPLREDAARVADESARLIGVNEKLRPEDFHIDDNYYGDRYGVPTEAGNRALIRAAQAEGLVLDPVYTAKAMSALMDMASTQKIDTQRTVVFLHTGGSPALMAFEDQFRGLARFSIAQAQEDDSRAHHTRSAD